MLNVLVTGATGFIGPAVVAQLRGAGLDVACLVRPAADTSRLVPLGASLVTGDVTQPASLSAALRDVDLVIHLAGRTHARSRAEFAQVNETGTRNVAAACMASVRQPRLVVVSSLAAAGPGTVANPRSEADPCQPVSHYGQSKLAGELAAREFAGHVATSIVRPPMVYGPGDRDGLLLARTIARTGWHVVPRRGMLLSLVHVDDLASAIWKIAQQGEHLTIDRGDARGVYHVAHPATSSLTEVGQLMAVALNRRLRLLRVRPWVFATAALAAEVRVRLGARPGVVGWDKFREASSAGWVANVDKSCQQLDWKPAVEHAQGLKQTIDWYLDRAWL